MGLYYNGKKVRNLYYNGKCITRLALGKEMTRLVEGDDFVRAQWLVGDGTAYIDTLVNSLTNSSGISCTYKIIDSVSDNRIFGREGYANYGAARCVARHFINQLDIWGYGASNEITFQSPNNIIHNLFIDLDLRSASLNGVSSSFYCTRNKEYNFFVFAGNTSGVPSGRVAGVSFSKFEIIDLVHLTPCRLLRPIPAALDGNGIARNAGDCGMFDSISGKFFGNVAASGAFTVEPSLVEGVDYERHRWLVGDGSAYINTLVSDLTNVRNIYCKIKRPSDVSGIYNQRVFGRENSSGYSDARFVVRPYDNHLDLFTSTASYTLFTDDDDYINVDAESNTASTSRQSKTIEDIKKNGISLGLFADHSTTSYFGAFYKGSIGEFTIDGTINLTPVRLLRPLPSYLDANGKARHQFECGMLDLKTKKFYGNVNTTGKFTVSDN